jgi:CDP-diacylglycerol--glycerol-3-phosphate 3-phosphatidyltransferase
MAAAPFIFFLLFLPWRFAAFAATLLFLLASFTDTLDGELARRLHLSSPLGVFLDTTADKVLVAVVTVGLVQVGAVPAWMVATILAREFLMMGVRSYAAVQGVIIPAGRWGKGKTAVTVVAITAVLLNLDVQGAGVLTAIDSDRVLAHTLPSASYWLMVAAVIWTVASGLEYGRGALPLLRSGLRAGARAKR